MSQKTLFERVKGFFHLELIPEWKKFWKMTSVWFILLMGALPDIYTGLSSMGLLTEEALPAFVVYAIRTLAAMAVIARIVKQRSLEEKPTTV